LAANNYEVAKVNLLLSMATEEDAPLSHKYKASALIEFLRSSDKIAPAGDSKSREPGSHLPQKDTQPAEGAADDDAAPKTNEKESGPAYGNIRLSQ
jgi:tetratricopeptide (TPR) repeat protein